MEALLMLNIILVILALIVIAIKEMITNYQKKSTRNKRSA